MKNFLIKNETARRLYNHVKDLPIIDYHNHLDPKEVYENKPFTNISDMWLLHDHYKWRLMRYAGIESHKENKLDRFLDMVKGVENAYMNPVKDWLQMELDFYFGIEEELTSNNALEIYRKVNKVLQNNPFGPQELLKKSRVEVLCTTDDIMSDLYYHKKIKDDDSIKTKVLPTFRPDKLFTDDIIEFKELLAKLGDVTNLSQLEKAIQERIAYFDTVGCKLSDHGITKFEYSYCTKEEAETCFLNKIENNTSDSEIIKLNGYILRVLMSEYNKRNWTAQFHLGALRDTNNMELGKYGKDSGYDSISGYNYTNQLTEFFNDVYATNALPRVIIYPLNSNHYEEITVMCANFTNGEEGKVQLGAAWWFHDHAIGITKHLEVFSSYLNLSNFMGMLTDSRSFLSMVRHDYFRRVLCNFIATKIENGYIGSSEDQLIKLVQRISYSNSKNYLEL